MDRLLAESPSGDLVPLAFGKEQSVYQNEEVARDYDPVSLLEADLVRQFPEKQRDDGSAHDGHD